jgi:cephalosporin hydroxylase
MNPFRFPAPTDHQPGGWHAGYMEVYHRLFQTVGPGSVLEIGCDGGGGILSYADYFGDDQKREFISCDISTRPDSLDANTSIRHYQGDAYRLDFISEVLKSHAPYAAIIEDGPHTLSSQMFFAENFPQMLSVDGVAIIEDIQDASHVAKLHGKLPPDFFGFGVDLRWQDNRYDSLLMVIQRK